MKRRAKTYAAFTLVETLVVLSVVSLMIVLAVSFRPVNVGPRTADFEKMIVASYEHCRVRAQTGNHTIKMFFQHEGVQIGDQLTAYPAGFTLQKEQILYIQPSGFVSSQTIVFEHNRRILRFIIQFGGGGYRFEE